MIPVLTAICEGGVFARDKDCQRERTDRTDCTQSEKAVREHWQAGRDREEAKRNRGAQLAIRPKASARERTASPKQRVRTEQTKKERKTIWEFMKNFRRED